MKQYLLFILLAFIFFGCEDTKQKKTDEKPKYDLYELSEMAELMEFMYKFNQELRQEVIKDSITKEFPQKFLEIDSAELTSTFNRDETFESFSQLFINAEKEIFNSSSQIALKDRYNNMVNLCISCHQTSCTGPIPRIKKLLIP